MKARPGDSVANRHVSHLILSYTGHTEIVGFAGNDLPARHQYSVRAQFVPTDASLRTAPGSDLHGMRDQVGIVRRRPLESPISETVLQAIAQRVDIVPRGARTRFRYTIRVQFVGCVVATRGVRGNGKRSRPTERGIGGRRPINVKLPEIYGLGSRSGLRVLNTGKQLRGSSNRRVEAVNIRGQQTVPEIIAAGGVHVFEALRRSRSSA